MTFTTSALLLSWLAIVLLALGFAGLLRQVTVLSRRAGSATAAPATGAAHSTRDLVGFRLPNHGALADLIDPERPHTLIALVSPGCPSCQQTLERAATLRAEVESGEGSPAPALVAVSTGSCAPAEQAMAGAGRCVPQGRHLLEALRAPATPYLVLVDRSGTITDTLLPHEDTDLGAWWHHATAAGSGPPLLAPGADRAPATSTIDTSGSLPTPVAASLEKESR